MSKQQWEEEAIARFVTFLSTNRGVAYTVTGRDVVVNPTTGENFDYQLKTQHGQKAAVEIFRLVESEEELAREGVWARVVKLLQGELLKRGIKGYLIVTPAFSISKHKMNSFVTRLADDLAKAIRANHERKTFEHNGFQFSRIDEHDTVWFSLAVGTRSVDLQGAAANSFAKLLPKKNQQVDVVDHERIICVVNQTMFVGAADTVRALSSFDFEELENIDTIYFEPGQGQFTLIFDRSVVEAIKERRNIDEPGVAELLVQYLRYQLGNRNTDAFEFVKTVTSASGDISWLSDTGARENLVRFGEELVAKGLLGEAMWIVRQLEHDPDPDPTGATDRYHLMVTRDEQTGTITTVRGHLCWLMAKLIAQNRPEYYTEIIAIVKRYITDQNLYIRKQVAVPLTELVRRRKAVRNADGSPFHWNKDERELVKTLAFQMLRQNVKYPRVLEALLSVFDGLRDLNETEANEVLLIFIARNEDYILRNVAALVVYFALFREKDFPADGPFDKERFTAILKKQVGDGAPPMRSSLAWHFWKIIHDKLLPYENVKEYLFFFWRDRYDVGVASMFGLLFEELAKIAPDDAVELFQNMLSRLKHELKAHPDRNGLYWIDGTEEIITLMTANPELLISTVKDLKEIWMSGTHSIGDLNTIFGSYRLVVSQHKERVKFELFSVFEEMRKTQPKLPQVDWDQQ